MASSVAPPRCGSKDHPVRLSQRAERRFLFIDIQTGSKELAGIERFQQRRFVHQSGPGRIDQNGPSLDQRKAVPVDHMSGLGPQGRMQRYEIGFTKTGFQRGGPLEIAQILDAGRMYQNAHVERSGQHLAKPRARMAPANHQRRLALQFEGLIAIAETGLACALLPVRRRNETRGRKRQPQRQFGNGLRIGARRVANQNAMAGGRILGSPHHDPHHAPPRP